jgi:hypothetical protein
MAVYNQRQGTPRAMAGENGGGWWNPRLGDLGARSIGKEFRKSNFFYRKSDNLAVAKEIIYPVLQG